MGVQRVRIPTMCGRYVITAPPEAMARLFKLEGALPNLPPRWNAAPTQKLPVIRLNAAGARELALLQWGLVPAWSKEPGAGPSPINARAEGILDKPMFRSLMKTRRCLVVADGFYEWKALGPKRKQPFFISLKEGAPMVFAGLWDRWQAKDGSETIESFCIIVCAANAFVAPVHDRMPVILSPAAQDLWLDPKMPPDALVRLLVPYDPAAMQSWPVDPRAGNVRYDEPGLVVPLKTDLFEF
jgi:putative SOS response-associated peptidase YedK